MRSARDLPLALMLFAGLALAGPSVAAASDLVAVKAPQSVRSSGAVGAAPAAAFVIAEPSVVQTSASLDVAPALASRSWMGSVAAIEAALSPASSGSERGLIPTPIDKVYCPPWAPCSRSCPMYCYDGR